MWGKYVICINNISKNLIESGKYENAMECLKKALDAGLNKLSKNHIEVANIYNSIGVVYEFKGDYDKALEYFHKSLAIKLDLLGENHPSVATSYNNIGNAYKNIRIKEIMIEHSNIITNH